MSSNLKRTSDQSENLYSTAKSPKRSILRTGESPFRFNSPLYSQDPGSEQRRVSFAPDANFRVFNQTDSPNASMRFETDITTDIHITDNIPFLLDEDEPSMLLNNAIDSPSSSFLRKPSTSPSDFRIRRSDLFGSPKSPLRRSGGAPPTLLKRVQNEGDLTDLLPNLPTKSKINIFEDDEDEDEDEVVEKPKETFQNFNDYESEEEMQLTQVEKPQENNKNQNNDDDMIITQTTSNEISSDEESIRITQTTPVDTYSDDENMDITQTTLKKRYIDEEATRSVQTTPTKHYSDDDNMDITQNTHITDYQEDISMQITGTGPIRRYSDDESLRTTQTNPVENYSYQENMELTQERDSDVESMNITQTTPVKTLLKSSLKNPLGSPYRSPQASPYRSAQASPYRSLQASPIRSPFRSSLRSSLGTPPKAPVVTSLKTPTKPVVKSPLRTPLKSPLRTPLRGSFRSPLGTPQRAEPSSSNRYLQSPIRSTSNYTLSAISPRSFYLHEKESVGSNRKSTFQEDISNVFQESPRYYNVHDEVVVNEPKMSLSDFLRHAGITFPKDFPTNESIFNPSSEYDLPVTEAHDISSSVILPEIHLYQQACKQLIDSIRKSDEIIENIERDISIANPQLFTEFVDGSAATQLKIQDQLQAIKRYSLIRSRQEWLTLWTNSIREFPNTLMDLQKQLNLYYEFEQSIGEKLIELNQYHDEIMVIVNRYRQKKRDYHMIDHEQLHRLSTEIENQEFLYQELKKNADELEAREEELKQEDDALEAEILELNKLLKDAEETIEQNQCITTRDLVDAKKEYDHLSDMFGWDIKQMDDEIFHLEIDDGVEIIIDLKKLADHASDAVFCQLSNSKDNELGPLVALLQGFKVVGKDQWDIHQIIQEIAIYWNRVRLIIRAIQLVQRRSWVRVTALENLGNPKEAGFSFEICLFNFEGKSKSNIAFEYKVKDIMKFPEIDFSTLTVEICYGEIQHDTLKELLIQALSKGGILSIAESLQSVMKQTLVSTGV